MFIAYGMKLSGNCYKVQLALEQLQLPYRWVEVDALYGETRTPEYLARNANGKVPLLEIEPGKYLPESNAILCYLAADSALLPNDRYEHAQVLQWMFFEQYSHEPNIAVARVINAFLPPEDGRRADLPRLHERGNQALAVMEHHLATRTYFVGERYSVADIALYAYTHCSADGGFDLSRYPAVSAWLARVAAMPLHVTLGA